MCFSQPKPPKLPDPPPLPKVAPPAPPPPPVLPPKQLQQEGAAPDLRIGSQKAVTSSRKRVNTSSMKSGLNMGGNAGGLNI